MDSPRQHATKWESAARWGDDDDTPRVRSTVHGMVPSMTHVVTSSCYGCRYTDCVAVCPVDCFHGDEQMLYIAPDRCIDCGACVPECPVEAIYDEGSLPDDERSWLSVNAERAPHLPRINRRLPPLQDAEARARAFGFKPR